MCQCLKYEGKVSTLKMYSPKMKRSNVKTMRNNLSPVFDQCTIIKTPIVNPYHDEFLKWNNQPYIFGTFHYHFF